MKIYRICGCTETGPVRKANEDHILIGRFIKNRGSLSLAIDQDDDFLSNYGLILAVADGIGGAAAGGLASRMALMALDRQFYAVEKGGQDLQGVSEVLKSAAVRANESLLSMGAKRPDLQGMGCTLTGVCLTPHGYLVFNAGDSRVYRFRSSLLKPLTRDDSVVALAVESGGMTQEEAEGSPARHTLTNCVGSNSFSLNETREQALIENDMLLICSDGLHDLVSHEELKAILATDHRDPGRLVTALVDRAVQNGGRDNISVILLQYHVEELAEISEPGQPALLMEGKSIQEDHHGE